MIITNTGNAPSTTSGHIVSVDQAIRAEEKLIMDSDSLRLGGINNKHGEPVGRWEFLFSTIEGGLTRRRSMSIGHYPAMSLDEARIVVCDLYNWVRDGRDPHLFRARNIECLFPTLTKEEMAVVASMDTTPPFGSKMADKNRKTMTVIMQARATRERKAKQAAAQSVATQAQAPTPAPVTAEASPVPKSTTQAQSSDKTVVAPVPVASMPMLNDVDRYVVTLAFQRLIHAAASGKPVPPQELRMARAVLARAA